VGVLLRCSAGELEALQRTMASAKRAVVAVSLALALCCVVTLNFNSETIKAEVAVQEGHAGMMRDHSDDDEDSDELSASEKALIAAADSGDEPVAEPTLDGEKAKSKKTVQNSQPSEDDLSPEERDLIAAASAAGSKKAPEDAEAVAVAAPKVKKTVNLSGLKHSIEKAATSSGHSKGDEDEEDDEDDEDLSPAEKKLIEAAEHNSGPKVAAKPRVQKLSKAMPAKKVANHPDSDLASEKAKLLKDSDDLTPAEKKLIKAAGNKKFGHKKPVVVGQPMQAMATGVGQGSEAMTDDMMKKAMEQITQAAAQQAVAAQTAKLSAPSGAETLSAPPAVAVAEPAKPKVDPTYDARKIVMGNVPAPAAHPVLSFEDDAKADSDADEVKALSWEEKLKAADKRAEEMARMGKVPKSGLTAEEKRRAQQMRKELQQERRQGMIHTDSAEPAPMLMPAPMLDAVMRGNDAMPLPPIPSMAMIP